MGPVTVEVPVSEGSAEVVRVQVRAAEDGLAPVGRGERVAARASRTLDEMIDSVRPVADRFVSRLSQMENPPDDITLEFGVSLTAGADMVIATTGADANFSVTMSWSCADRPDRPAAVPPAD